MNFPHTLNSRRDLSDPELAGHLTGFRGYVWGKSNGQMTKTVYHVMRHIERVRNQVSFNVEDHELDLITPWGWEANAIFYLPDGSVRDPAGLILVDPASREPHPAAKLPYPPDAYDRKAHTDAQLQRMNIYVPPSVPPVVGMPEARLRSPREVAQRTLSLFVAAVRAESIGIGKPMTAADLGKDWPIAFAALSPAEHEFLFADDPPQQSVINFAWRYEALALLQWALGVADELPFPTAICDVPKIARIAFECNSQDYVDKAVLRPTPLLLDALDLHYRLHWAVTQAQLDKRAAPASIDPGVVVERHHALNWLVRFEDADWDNVDTPT